MQKLYKLLFIQKYWDLFPVWIQDVVAWRKKWSLQSSSWHSLLAVSRVPPQLSSPRHTHPALLKLSCLSNLSPSLSLFWTSSPSRLAGSEHGFERLSSLMLFLRPSCDQRHVKNEKCNCGFWPALNTSEETQFKRRTKQSFLLTSTVSILAHSYQVANVLSVDFSTWLCSG